MELVQRNALSILVVEDDVLIRKLLKTIIAMKFPGALLLSAENGKRGLDLFKAHVPEIVITDIKMPLMDGIRMAWEIRSIKADTRIIVVTAYDDAHSVEKFREIGCDEFMVKPIQFESLCTAIGRCMGEVTQ